MRYTLWSASRGILLLCTVALVLVSCQNDAVNPLSSVPNGASSAEGAGGVAPLQKANQRPISDFLTTQSNPIFLIDGTNPVYTYWIDFTGAIAISLGLPTTFSGSILEKPLPNGTAEETIDIRSRNVLTWVGLWTNPAVTVLGRDPTAVSLGAPATLGDLHLKVTLIAPAPGAPIPDMLNNPQLITRFQLEASAFGPMHPPAASEGTPGHAWTNQVGLVTKVNGKPGIDGFTVEFVNLKPVGATH